MTTQLDDTQLAALRAAVKADVTLATAYAEGDTYALAAAFNTVATPQVSIWGSRVATSDILTAVVWSEWASLAANLQTTARDMMLTPGIEVDSTNTNFQAGLSLVFAEAPQTRAGVTLVCQHLATRFENMFTSGQFSSVVDIMLSADDIAAACFNDDGSQR